MYETPVYPETFEQMEVRVEKAEDMVLGKYTGDILLIGHGASVCVSARTVVGKDAEIKSALCCLIKVVWEDNRWVLN